ncbi:MAG: sigma-70 family RNA polymerase sigma factor [candidate division Zixibacteria bacterium]|nr:sigma-70 family RNA polymerase sigma factor [candidate division Zixibacteria bacterium]
MVTKGILSSYKELTDPQLAELMQRGDMKAFEVLVERYRQKAFYLALGLVGDADEAADVSQEAFIRVYRAAKRFDTSEDFFGWFYVILSNLARNRIKKRQVRAAHVRQEQADTDAIRHRQSRSNPDLLLEADETKKLVWEAIERLPYNFREIIILRHFEELPYGEIAGLLDIPIGSVMSRLYYARLKLKTILETANE